MPVQKPKTSSTKVTLIKLTTLERRVLKAALSIAAEKEWYNISLSEVASIAGFELNEVLQRFPDTNAIANTWFEQALYAMLAPLPKAQNKLPISERLEIILLRWFKALTPQKQVTVGMLRSKFHLPHIHHWGPLVFALSRHVQLWRETAMLRAVGRQRQIEEIALTAIFLGTLVVWCNDATEGQLLTQKFLKKKLSQGEGIMSRYFEPTH